MNLCLNPEPAVHNSCILMTNSQWNLLPLEFVFEHKSKVILECKNDFSHVFEDFVFNKDTITAQR